MNFIKLVQIVNYILAKYDYRLNYTKLLKLIYLADRECLDRYGFAISGDTYCSMRHGPVLERLYALIKKGNDKRQIEWNTYFYTNGYNLFAWHKADIAYEDDVAYGELSADEMEVVDYIDSLYHDKDWRYLVDRVVHELPELDSNVMQNNTSTPIDKRTIMKYLGKSDDEIDELISLDRCSNEMQRLYGVDNDHRFD